MGNLTQAKLDIFNQFRTLMGAPIREVELTDEQLCILLDMSVEDYARRVQDWLIEHQWQTIFGQNIDNTDIAFALSVRDFNFVTQYTYAYSKQVGLQTRGPWELKKDFIEIESGRQVYQIPAGREVNEVLWLTPSSTDHALFTHLGGFDGGFGGGFAQMGSGYGMGSQGGFGGLGGYYITPAYDVLLAAQDINLKNRMIRGDLTYKMTAGPDGTRLLHLISTPGSKFTFGNGLAHGASGIGLQGCHVWYHYYDTTTSDVDQCRKDNPDIIRLPNEVPLSKINFEDLNEPTRIFVRQVFMAHAKIALARVRGKFGGVVGPPEAQRTMDYESILSEGQKELDELFKNLDEKLLRLSSTKQLERAAEEAENINKQLKFRPLGFYFK